MGQRKPQEDCLSRLALTPLPKRLGDARVLGNAIRPADTRERSR